MSAIAGIFYRDGRPVGDDVVTEVSSVLEHRGPDGDGVQRLPSMALVQKIMFTTPESMHERLPLQTPEGDVILVCDVRLDNRDILADKLGIRDAPDVPDSHFVVEAYRRWGVDCAEHLLGPFAIALWDARKERLYCARDHIGFRPFFYYLSDSTFAFGSEIKAVLALEEVPRVLDEERIAEFLLQRFDSTSSTFFRHVRRLPSASWMLIGRDTITTHRYWQFDPEFERGAASTDEFAEEFSELFERAVAARIRSAFPLGAHSTGGLDSTSIVIAARDQLRGSGTKLHTFTARFPSLPACDEGRYADAAVALDDVISHQVFPEDANFLDDLDRMLWHHDEPIPLPTLVLESALHGAAQVLGVRTMLSGSSGDITFSHGDGWFHELLERGRWLTLARELRSFSRLRRVPMFRYLMDLAVLPSIRASVPKPVYQARWAAKGLSRYRPRLLHEALDMRTGYTERLLEEFVSLSRLKRTQRGFHYFRLRDDWIARSTETGDLVGAAFRQRVAYPFFDKRLLEFGLSLPADQKISNGYSRIVLRRAMEGRLPPVILTRWSKTGLTQLVHRSLFRRNAEPLRDFVNSELPSLDGLVNIPMIRQAVDRGLAADATTDPSFTEDVWSVQSALMIQRWLKQARVARDPG